MGGLGRGRLQDPRDTQLVAGGLSGDRCALGGQAEPGPKRGSAPNTAAGTSWLLSDGEPHGRKGWESWDGHAPAREGFFQPQKKA